VHRPLNDEMEFSYRILVYKMEYEPHSKEWDITKDMSCGPRHDLILKTMG
jgi:hypothetical protein